MTKRKLDRATFLSSSTKLRKEMVELDEGVVYVRELSGKAVLEYNEKIEELKKQNKELTTSNSLELLALLVSKSVCDEDGNLLFTEADVNSLMDTSMNTLKKLSEKVLQISGVSPEVIAEVADKLKNDPQNNTSTTN